jgi:hypothetical protein
MMKQSEVRRSGGEIVDLHVATHVSGFQVDALEQDAFEVLRLVRSMKNSLAPINRIPPEVLSLIPDYYHEYNIDQDLIAFTHVCRSWRDTFISRSSLWTKLDFIDTDKTRTYIQRSQSSPFELYLQDDEVIDDAFPLIIPHIQQLKSLTVDARDLPSALRHFRCHVPLLRRLDINISAEIDPVLDSALFNGDFSSLHELYLFGVLTDFPWKNLSNLRVVDLTMFFQSYGTTQILDFLESAPLLHTVSLHYPMEDSSDTPPERIVTLRHLKTFTIEADEPPSILLHHLHIPSGTSLTSEFYSDGLESPLPDYLAKRFPNFSNLSDITAINLFLDSNRTFVQFSGPSGNLRVLARWRASAPRPTFCRILRSLDPILSKTERLVLFKHKGSEPADLEDRSCFETLSSADHLRTLTLTDPFHLPFIRALDPEQHPSSLVLCFNLEELVLYPQDRSLFDVEHLIRMVKNRTSRGAILSSITLVDISGNWQEEEMFRLREHVTHVEYRVGGVMPHWDDTPNGSGGEKK